MEEFRGVAGVASSLLLHSLGWFSTETFPNQHVSIMSVILKAPAARPAFTDVCQQVVIAPTPPPDRCQLTVLASFGWEGRASPALLMALWTSQMAAAVCCTAIKVMRWRVMTDPRG